MSTLRLDTAIVSTPLRQWLIRSIYCAEYGGQVIHCLQHLWIQIIRCIYPCWSNCRAGLWPPFKLEIVHAALLYINCFHWSLNTPRLDPTRCQLMENTPDLNRGFFDLDQVGGITTKVLGSGGRVDFTDKNCFPALLSYVWDVNSSSCSKTYCFIQRKNTKLYRITFQSVLYTF